MLLLILDYFMDVPGHASNAIAAHLRLCAITVVDEHCVIAFVLSWHDKDQAIGADAVVTIAVLCERVLCWRKRQCARALGMVHQYKVISKSLILMKLRSFSTHTCHIQAIECKKRIE